MLLPKTDTRDDRRGGVHAGPEWRNVTTLPREEFHRIFETNLYVPFYLTQAAVPHMRPGSSLSEWLRRSTHDRS
jgi:NAD(P)-dependent dehydrogenase (short-subunit alcohol dehydrogenase family)